MAGFSTSAKNTMLNAITPDTVGLHSADPGANGTASELTGGSPAYARKAVSMNAAASGQRTASTQPIFDVPAGSTVAFVSWWAGATFLGSGPVGTQETFAGQGTYQLTSETLSIT